MWPVFVSASGPDTIIALPSADPAFGFCFGFPRTGGAEWLKKSLSLAMCPAIQWREKAIRIRDRRNLTSCAASSIHHLQILIHIQHSAVCREPNHMP
jgi:hypothetical protein